MSIELHPRVLGEAGTLGEGGEEVTQEVSNW